MKSLLTLLLLLPCWCWVSGQPADLPSATTHTPPPYTIHDSTLKRLIREGKIDTTPIEKIFKDIARSQGWDTVPIPIRPTQPLPAWPMRDIRIIREPLRIDNECDLELALTKVAIDSLKKELLKCQEKSKVDEATIQLLFKSLEIYKSIITVPTKKRV